MKDDLGDRMKKNYEDRFRYYLPRRLPTILRLDLVCGHTITKNLNRPFDGCFMDYMIESTLNLCKQISGCHLGYVQSDEISLLLIDYENLDTEAWFDNNLQKLCSVSASMATYYFNEAAHNDNRLIRPILFDSRAFTIPKEEVCNYFYWRQKDASRNSISMLAQSLFSHKDLQNLSQSALQDKMMNEKGINWDKLAISQKRGTCVYKRTEPQIHPFSVGESVSFALGKVENTWIVDREIPIFNQNREYIEKHL